MGGITAFSWKALTGLIKRRLDLFAILYQSEGIGNKAFALVALVAIFTGMVMALQLSVGLGRFGLKLYIGQVVGLTIVRELGPVLACLMIGARVGAGIAAELGSMVVTEQVLAIEAMGANPVTKLVVPRVLACLISAPLLTVMADIIGIFGGMTITLMEDGMTAQVYLVQDLKNVVM